MKDKNTMSLDYQRNPQLFIKQVQQIAEQAQLERFESGFEAQGCIEFIINDTQVWLVPLKRSSAFADQMAYQLIARNADGWFYPLPTRKLESIKRL